MTTRTDPPNVAKGVAKNVTETDGNYLGRTFRPFRHKDFRLIWAGAFTSTTGSWMQNVAQSWLVLQLTGSAFFLGLVGFLADLPILLFSLVGGVVADRSDRRKLLLISQYLQMTSAFILTFLVLADMVRIWHILALVFLSGIGQAFGGPAYAALIPGLVKRDELPNAIALNSIQFNLARMVGPLVAGVTMATGGIALCFGLNGLSFLAVIISLYVIRATFVPPKTEASVMEGFRQGISYVKSQGPLWQLSVLGFVSTFCGIPLMTMLPVFAQNIFNLDATGYSYMMASSGGGAITGALLYAGLPHRMRQVGLTLKVAVAMSVFIIIFAVSRNLLLSHVVLFFFGMSLIALFASITSMVQLVTAEEMRGRTMSIFMLAFRGGMPLGSLAVGTLADQLTPTIALMVFGTLLGGIALGFLFFNKSLKHLY